MYNKSYICNVLPKEIYKKLNTEGFKYIEVVITMYDNYEYYFNINDALGLVEYDFKEGYPFRWDEIKSIFQDIIPIHHVDLPLEDLTRILEIVSQYISNDDIKNIKITSYWSNVELL